jgi:DNA-binding SARP family transcriptional activator/tetratricopeptide (TPR) repeat protein
MDGSSRIRDRCTGRALQLSAVPACVAGDAVGAQVTGHGAKENGAVQFGLLGPLQVIRDGAELRVRGAKPRALLAVLLLDAGRLVPADRLVAVLWDGDAPRTARASLSNHVHVLRRALGDAGGDLVRTAASGYSIDTAPGDLDVQVFEDRLRHGRAAHRAGDWALASEELAAALKLWRGEPLPELPAAGLLAEAAARWSEQRLQALEWRIDSDLRLGKHADVVAELSELVTAHPLRENLAGLLMVACYQSGRQAESLAVYRRTRDVLVGELGAEPGVHLQELHRRILVGDPGLSPGPAAQPAAPRTAVLPAGTSLDPRPGRAAGGEPVPQQLPPAVPHFTGRAAALKALADITGAAGPPGGTVVISAIDGTAGIGKTALALYWAHQVADRFPDGQLYVNLRGFDPGGPPVPPPEAVRGFLAALGVPPARIPIGLEAQAAQYRSLLAGKRMLVLLDNARDAGQVRPLLPGSPGCLVLVTSRVQLLSLVAADGAHPLTLDLFTRAEARDLLGRRLGAERVRREQGAADELIGLSARLPLALNIVAARAASQPAISLAALVRQLRDMHPRLDMLHAGDPATDVRAVISWSCQHLGAAAGRMFRLLGGVHPGPDISAPAAASLAGVPLRQARQALGELTGARLLMQDPAGRFSFHDLLREYAAEQAQSLGSDAERDAARRRVLDHYLHTTYRAALLLAPAKEPITVAAPEPGAGPEAPADDAEALAWLEAEYPVLFAAIAVAARSGLDTHAWQLAWGLADFLARRGHWQAYAATHEIALAAAHRLGDLGAQARVRRDLGYAHGLLGSYQDARTHLQRSLDLYRQLGQRSQEAMTYIHLAHLAWWQDRNAEARDHAQQALDIARAEGHRATQANALNTIGLCSALLGEHPKALACCQQALDLLGELNDRLGQGATLDSLGYIYLQLGDHQSALDHYQQAFRLFTDVGDRYKQSVTLTGLGDTHHAVGHIEAARESWREALVILSDLRHPDADTIRGKLSQSLQLGRSLPVAREGAGGLQR